eukprot:1375202-Amphidinium_carterae.2
MRPVYRLPNMGATLYRDGACQHSKHATIRRAAWAWVLQQGTVVLDQNSGLLDLESSSDQTVYAAEVQTIRQGIRAFEGTMAMHIVCDNQAAVNALTNILQGGDYDGPDALPWQDIRTHVATRQVTVQKIQSHQKEPLPGTREHERWQGNARADLLATQALQAEGIKHELAYNKKLYDDQVKMVK